MKDKTAIFIGESVDIVNNNYWKLIYKTKRIFFDYLQNKKSLKEFDSEIHSIWDKTDHTFMKQRITELEKMIDTQELKSVTKEAVEKEIYKINTEMFYKTKEQKYVEDIMKYYDGRLTTIKKGTVEADTYLSQMVEKYDSYQQNIPYYSNGVVRSWHNVADYLSMVYNTDLTHSGWNRTLYDADLLDNDLLYLPAHPNACPLCLPYQGKIYSKSGKDKQYPSKEVAIEGGVGHPNCKHVWTIYWDESQIQANKFTTNGEEIYKKDQKKKALERKSKSAYNDMKIYKSLGNVEMYDKSKLTYRGLRKKIKEI